MEDTRLMSIADSIKCGLPTFSHTAKYNRGDRFVYEGNVCEVTDVMDGEAGTCRVYDQESGTLLADNSITWREYTSSSRIRLVCEYCGCISDKDYGTCEHCGAVLTEPQSADLDEVMKRWW